MLHPPRSLVSILVRSLVSTLTSCNWNMSIMKVLCLLLLHVALVIPGTQICKDSDENAYSIITCGAPGKNGLPGLNGLNGEKGEPGPQGPKGEKGDSMDTAIENLKLQMTVMESRMRDLQSYIEKQEKVFSFGKEIYRSTHKTYILNRFEATYDEAKTICASGGGQLAVPRTQEENKAILSLCQKAQRHIVLGINDLQYEGDYRDVSGQVIRYFNWQAGEPNGLYHNDDDCVEMWSNGKWNVKDCETKHFFVCEF